MKHYTIKNRQTGKILFEGAYKSFKFCLEDAVQAGTALDYADLRNQDLTNITLDGANLHNADFSSSNLTGANLSECLLLGSAFINTNLYATCLCSSIIDQCNFEGAAFGGTDIFDAIIRQCNFNTLSFFSLNFRQARSISRCLYTDANGHKTFINAPPIVISGVTPQPISIIGDHIRIGHTMSTSIMNKSKANTLLDYKKSLTSNNEVSTKSHSDSNCC